MQERELQQTLIDILCSELTCTILNERIENKLTPEVITALYKLSKTHDLAHIVSATLGKLGLLGADEISMKLQKQEMLSVYRCERIKYEFEQICNTLDEANIPYIPLKGSVIRSYYPYESMRTSCDIDILVRGEQLDDAIDVIVGRLSYEKGGRGDHDITLTAANGIHLELHFSLIEGDENIDETLSKVWTYSSKEKNSKYRMSDDFMLFYHIAHMTKHFYNGGCGVRPFMDMWIMEHKMGISRNCGDELLKTSGLDKFTRASFSLADAWFGGKEHTELTLNMQDYIMNAGVYGSLENRVAVGMTKYNSKLKYILGRVFIPYREMVMFFPSLKKCPLLLPFFYGVRIFRVIKGKRISRRMQEIRYNDTITDSRREHIKNLCDELGL